PGGWLERLGKAHIRRPAVFEQADEADATGEGIVVEGVFGGAGDTIEIGSLDLVVTTAQRQYPAVIELHVLLRIEAELPQFVAAVGARGRIEHDRRTVYRIVEIQRTDGTRILDAIEILARVVEADQRRVFDAAGMPFRFKLVVER